MFSFPTIVNEFGISSCKLSENAIVTSLHVDDDLIALSLNNGTVHLLRSTGEHIAELKADDSVCLWSLAVKNKLLVAGGFDGYLQVWDLESRHCAHSLKGHSDTVRSIHILDSSTAISRSKDGAVIVWNLVTGEPTAILRHREQHAIRTIAMKNDIAFVGTYKGNLIQWNVSTRECLGVFIIHQSIIYAISVSDEYLFTGGADSTIVSRDLQTRTHRLLTQAHRGPISILKMNGQNLLSAGFFGVVTAWLSQSFTVKWSETAHTGSVTTLASNDKMVLTGGIDGEVQMMNLGTGARIDHAFTKVETIWKVAFTPDRAVVCGREDGVATVWMVPFPEVLRLVKARAFEPLENNFMKNT